MVRKVTTITTCTHHRSVSILQQGTKLIQQGSLSTARHSREGDRLHRLLLSLLRGLRQQIQFVRSPVQGRSIPVQRYSRSRIGTCMVFAKTAAAGLTVIAVVDAGGKKG